MIHFRASGTNLLIIAFDKGMPSISVYFAMKAKLLL